MSKNRGIMPEMITFYKNKSNYLLEFKKSYLKSLKKGERRKDE